MIDPKRVHETLSRHQLADGLPMVMDLERSHGAWLHDARTGREYLDFFTCFASWPIGYNHPMMSDAAFRQRLMSAALNNPANSDLYTSLMADFVEAFAGCVTPDDYPYHFWVAGGALAVENALKAAFDWKAQKVGVDKVDDGARLCALHLRQAFHGRSGYTMSLTNTVPDKIALFPKFDWPRVHNPAIEFDLDGGIANDVAAEEARSVSEIETAFRERTDQIACIILEPMQGEGGDNHFRPEYLAEVRRLCDENDALLIFDEIQTGFYSSGQAWLWQTKGVKPDIVAFGKKTQVCGIYSNRRIDEVADNVFHRSSRINSTWGGNLVDMVRCHRFIDIIGAERLDENIATVGERMLVGLRSLAREHGQITNVRGVGSLVAFTLSSQKVRDGLLASLMEKEVLALPSGPQSVRFRLPLMIGEKEVDAGLERVADCLSALVGS